MKLDIEALEYMVAPDLLVRCKEIDAVFEEIHFHFSPPLLLRRMGLTLPKPKFTFGINSG